MIVNLMEKIYGRKVTEAEVNELSKTQKQSLIQNNILDVVKIIDSRFRVAFQCMKSGVIFEGFKMVDFYYR